MDLTKLTAVSEYEWCIEPQGGMRVPGIIYADAALVREMDEKVREQICNVAKLPGIVTACYAMPDAHWGYGFPIGGVAAFDPQASGVVSAGGVGFDISCGVRCLLTGLPGDKISPRARKLVDALFARIPSGVGSTGQLRLSESEMDGMLSHGARWAVDRGYGEPEDLERTEEHGQMQGARPEHVSQRARDRQRDEVGTLGSGNHYLEVQRIETIFVPAVAAAFDLVEDEVVVSIHCGSRWLGHQIGTEFLRSMVEQAPKLGIVLPDRELACAPLDSDLAQRYLGAMRAAINWALANRQVITHLTREVFARLFSSAKLRLLYDVSHNTCKVEEHEVRGVRKPLYVHRKGATRAFGPGHPQLPAALREVGQPVLIGGSMGTSSYVQVGTASGMQRSFRSACHGAGRAMSRHAASKRWRRRALVDDLAARGILVRAHSQRGVAEEAPGAYKDVESVVEGAERAGLARRVARLTPMLCVKG